MSSRPLDPDQVIVWVCSWWGVSRTDLLKGRRYKPIPEAAASCVRLIHDLCGRSWMEACRAVGRDGLGGTRTVDARAKALPDELVAEISAYVRAGIVG